MLEARRFLVREQLNLLRSHPTCVLFDGDTGQPLGVAEEQLSGWQRLFRWFISKRLMSTRIEVREQTDDALVFTLHRLGYFFRSTVEVQDALGSLVGWFQVPLLSWRDGIWIYDRDNRLFAVVKGSMVDFDYQMFTPDLAVAIGRVTKPSGLSPAAKGYLVELDDDLQDQPIAKMLLLGAALATEMIFKSRPRKDTGGR